MRPFLTLECAELFGVRAEAAVETAAALECVHCSSLAHDDLPAMDDDDRRRGKPTVHWLCVRGRRHPRPDPASRTRPMQFVERVGLAFQIADDLLDLEGETTLLGKATGKDEGKASLVAALGGDEARARLGGLEAEAIALLAPFGGKADILCEAVRFVGQRQS